MPKEPTSGLGDRESTAFGSLCAYKQELEEKQFVKFYSSVHIQASHWLICLMKKVRINYIYTWEIDTHVKYDFFVNGQFCHNDAMYGSNSFLSSLTKRMTKMYSLLKTEFSYILRSLMIWNIRLPEFPLTHKNRMWPSWRLYIQHNWTGQLHPRYCVLKIHRVWNLKEKITNTFALIQYPDCLWFRCSLSYFKRQMKLG